MKVADTLVNLGLANGKLGGPMKATGRYERVACVLGNARKWRGGGDCVAGGGCSVAAWTLGLRTFTLASRLDIRHGGGGMGAAARGGGLHAAASNPMRTTMAIEKARHKGTETAERERRRTTRVFRKLRDARWSAADERKRCTARWPGFVSVSVRFHLRRH